MNLKDRGVTAEVAAHIDHNLIKNKGGVYPPFCHIIGN